MSAGSRGMPYFALVAWLTIGPSSVATGQPVADADAALVELGELILHARFEEARVPADALRRRSDLDAETRVRALELIATLHIAERDVAQADQVLDELYRCDPGHRLSDPAASPLVREAFDRAALREHPPLDVQLRHRVDATGPAVEVTLVSGSAMVAEVRVSHRSPGREFLATTVPASEASLRVPLSVDDGANTEFFIEALAPSGTVLAQDGTEARPHLLASDSVSDRASVATPGGPPSTESSTSVFERWWFWTIVGVVVVGTGIGLGFALSESDAPEGSLGGGGLR
ncbi:MAG: hypothetical protein AAGF12_26355 [Myxococcota bacterium]